MHDYTHIDDLKTIDMLAELVWKQAREKQTAASERYEKLAKELSSIRAQNQKQKQKQDAQESGILIA